MAIRSGRCRPAETPGAASLTRRCCSPAFSQRHDLHSPITSNTAMNPKWISVARLAAELEAEFQRLGPDTVAAFVAEPVVGATAGCVTAPEGYFQSRARHLQPARCPADPRRSDVRYGPYRHASRLATGGHCAGHSGHRPRDSAAAISRSAPCWRALTSSTPSGRVRRFPARTHLSSPSDGLCRRARGAEDHQRRTSARPV